MSDFPLVSICCITYNQKPYIRDTIEGFLMQKTSFPIEIIVHDDASTDGTKDIIKEYAKEHPTIIYPIFQTENQYSKKQGSIEARFVWPHARGKYIALCEGDDYWIDPYKLQKQVDFLDQNPDYSVSFHASKDLNMKTGNITVLNYECKNGFLTFTTKDAILNGGGFMTTNSVVFRSEFTRNFPEWFINAPTGDFALSLFLSSHGRIAYFDDVMSVYRRGTIGSWTERMSGIRCVIELHKATEKMLLSFNRYTSNKHFTSIVQKIIRNRAILASVYLRYIYSKFLKS